MTILFADPGTGPDANPIGGSWTTDPGFNAFRRLSNMLQGTTGSANNGAYVNSPSFPADQWAQFTFQEAALSDGTGLLLRVHDNGGGATNGYLCQQYPGTIAIARYTNGGYNPLTSVAHTYVQGEVLYFEVVGTAMTAKINGSTVLTGVTDVGGYTGPPGVYGFGASVMVNNFSAGDFVAGGDVKTVNGVVIAGVKTLNGVARASVKTINGVDL